MLIDFGLLSAPPRVQNIQILEHQAIGTQGPGNPCMQSGPKCGRPKVPSALESCEGSTETAKSLVIFQQFFQLWSASDYDRTSEQARCCPEWKRTAWLSTHCCPPAVFGANFYDGWTSDTKFGSRTANRSHHCPVAHQAGRHVLSHSYVHFCSQFLHLCRLAFNMSRPDEIRRVAARLAALADQEVDVSNSCEVLFGNAAQALSPPIPKTSSTAGAAAPVAPKAAPPWPMLEQYTAAHASCAVQPLAMGEAVDVNQSLR